MCSPQHFAGESITKQAIAAMEKIIYERMLGSEHGHWWFVGRRKIITALLHKLPLPKGARILEAGCGTGGNLGMLSQFGMVFAFEPDTMALNYSQAKGVGEIRQGSLPHDIPYPAEEFDLVAALDVLEHVDQDMQSLESLLRFVKPGGWLLITVPAFQKLWSAHDVLHHHKRRYSKTQLFALLKNPHATVELISYFNTWLFPVAAAARWYKKLLKKQTSAEDNIPPAMINRLFAGIFASERFLLGRVPMPVGLSLVMLVQKTGS
jgi:SAM-dependent methyltransferase